MTPRAKHILETFSVVVARLVVIIAVIGPVAYVWGDFWLLVVAIALASLGSRHRKTTDALWSLLGFGILILLYTSAFTHLPSGINRLIAAAGFAGGVALLYVHSPCRLVRSEMAKFSLFIGVSYSGLVLVHFQIAVKEDYVWWLGHALVDALWILNAIMTVRAKKTNDGTGFGRYILLMLLCVAGTAYSVAGAERVAMELAWWMPLSIIATIVFVISVQTVTWFSHQLDVLRRLSAYVQILAKPFAWFAIGYISIIVLFATWYWAINAASCPQPYDCPHPFAGAGLSPAASFTDFLYFSLVTVATVGFGDVVPQSDLARTVCALEVLAGIAWVTVVFAATVAYAQAKFTALEQGQVKTPDGST